MSRRLLEFKRSTSIKEVQWANDWYQVDTKKGKERKRLMKVRIKNKHGSRAWHDQPIDHIWAYMVSRLVDLKAKVMCCNSSGYHTLHIAQSPGSSHPTTRVAIHGKRVVPPLSSFRRG